jgi:hypothetical protein
MQMVRTWAAVVVAAALTLLLGEGARAQSKLPPRPFEVRIDSFFPYDSDTRSVLGSNFAAFGVGLAVLHKNWFVPVTYDVYADFYNRIRNLESTGRVQAQVWGLGVGARYDLNPNAVDPKFVPYFRVGVGVYTSYVKQDAPDGNTQSNQRTNIGGKFTLGAQHRSGVFAEGGYEYVPHPSIFGNDAALSGWLAGVGYRF